MKGYIALSEESRSEAPQLGDLIGLNILLEQKVGTDSDPWEFKQKEAWLPSGSLTINAKSLQQVPSDGQNTKFHLEALVHQPGSITTAELVLLHVPSGQEFTVVPGELKVEAKQIALAEDAAQIPWTLPPLPFGGWNYLLLALLLAILIGGLFLAGRKLLQKIRGKKKINHREQAIRDLDSLQGSAKSNATMKQEEWKKFSFALAGILRKYSDKNFAIDSSDLTDSEFLSELKKKPRATNQLETVSSILSTINEVRYGKKDLEANLVPILIEKARIFVEQTFAEEEKGGKK